MARIAVSPDGASIENARLPFAEQIAFFRQKLSNLIPTQRWDDILRSEHDKGFMVAGAMKADLLADLAQAVDRAIAEGKSIQWFRENFFEIVARHGWTGYTGADTKKGRAWRTRVIYQTNLLTSYNAGRLAQLKEGGFKYWIYHHDDSVRHPRPLHQAWDGLTLPADHDFWKTHTPPNGWGCQCYISGARSERGARRLGGDPDKPIDPEWLKTDPKTGAPVGIDRGWDYMPGATVVDTVRALRDKLDRLPPRPAIAVIQDWLGTEAFAAWLDNPQGNWPLVRLPDEDAGRIGAQTTVADLSPETAAKQKREHPELTPEEYRLAQRVIDGPDYKQVEKNPKTGTQSLVYIQVIDGNDSGGYVLVVKATKSGKGLFVTSYRRLSRQEAERDREIQRILRRRK